MEDLEKAKGIIMALPLGDAVGSPSEFLSLSQIPVEYGISDISDFIDDAQISIAIVEALIKNLRIRLPLRLI